MISLLKRTDALKNTINLKNTVISFQNVMYPEDYDTYTSDELEIYDVYNSNEFEIIKEADEYSNDISINYTDINSYTVKIAEKLIDLLQKVKTEELYIISHLKLDFFGNLNNKHKPLANAYKELKKITNSNSYNEAFRITVDELPVLINIFFWTERCDPSTPEYVFFADINDRFVFYLCKYGNVHTIEYGQTILTDAAQNSGWDIITDRCYDKFTDDGSIKGRRIKI